MYTNRSSWGRVFVLAGLLAFLLIGTARIMEFLYGIGLFPAVTQDEVVAQLKRTPNIEGLTCQQNVAGWEYVCDYVLRHHESGSVSRHREGIRTSWMTIGSRTLLPADGPVLSESEHAKWLEELHRKNRERAQPVNLRTATIADLRRIMPADPYLVEQIHAGVRSGTVSSVADLLKLKGMDRHKLDLIRSEVRWE